MWPSCMNPHSMITLHGRVRQRLAQHRLVRRRHAQLRDPHGTGSSVAASLSSASQMTAPTGHVTWPCTPVPPTAAPRFCRLLTSAAPCSGVAFGSLACFTF